MTNVLRVRRDRCALVLAALLCATASACSGGGSGSGSGQVVTPTPTPAVTPTPTPTPTPVAAPGAPSALIAVALDGAAALSWDASPTASSYTVARSTVSGGPYTAVASGITTNAYTDSGRSNGAVYYYVVSATNSAGTSPNAAQARVTPVAQPTSGTVRWPLSTSTSADADAVRYPYGGRRFENAGYDFHAGLDIPAPRGTPVHAIMEGTVTQITLDDGTTGPGNRVLINHGGQKWAAYLHLNGFAPGIAVGTKVSAGTLIGYVGKTGAEHYHLHLTYMVGLLSEVSNEGRSKNPLEVLPHTDPTGLTATFTAGNTVEISLPAHRTTVRWIILKGGGQTRVVDYYEIVTQGSVNRNEQSQSGVYIDASMLPQPDPVARLNFTLSVRPDPVSAFTVERIIVKDYNGNTLVDQTK